MQNRRTGQGLLHFIEDKVHELVVAFECANDFPATTELDCELFVEVLAQIEDVFYFAAPTSAMSRDMFRKAVAYLSLAAVFQKAQG